MGRSVLILGVGNPLAGDDGVGVRAIEVLAAASDLPEGIRLLDVGVARDGHPRLDPAR